MHKKCNLFQELILKHCLKLNADITSIFYFLFIIYGIFHYAIIQLWWTTCRFQHVCAHTWLGPHDWGHTTVPRHDCAQTRLCPDMIVPRHDCAQTHLICAQTRLCPGTLVPQHELLLWSDSIMSLVNNNIIIVFTRLIMCQLDWWKHKHAQLLLVFSNHQQYSWNISLLYYSMPTCQGTKYVSGHKHTCFCPDTIVTTRL